MLRTMRGLIAILFSICALPIIAYLIVIAISGFMSVKDFYYEAKEAIITEFGYYDSNPILIKDPERRERVMQEKTQEYLASIAKGKDTARADVTKSTETAVSDSLDSDPELARRVKEWQLIASQNPTMSPFAQATAFLKSAKGTVQDGVDHNELTQEDIAVITKSILSGDLSEIQKLDQIYERKDLVIINKDGITKRVYETPQGDLQILTLSKKLSDKLAAEKAAQE